VGVAPDGRTVRLPAVGSISGDWGGGGAVGHAGLTAALRGRDRRGPRTTLERLVPAAFDLTRPIDLTRAIYAGRIDEERLRELSPVVFRAAEDGDAVARSIVDHLADEVAIMANAAILRLHLTRRDPDVVLAGGVFRAEDAPFHERVRQRIGAVSYRATVRRLTAPPVVGSALVGLDRLAVKDSPAAETRLRGQLTDELLEGGRV
jgi:N-acetylglucosamine kinase-like BadF-type ATPase